MADILPASNSKQNDDVQLLDPAETVTGLLLFKDIPTYNF